jgi:hypothetical protein
MAPPATTANVKEGRNGMFVFLTPTVSTAS